MKSFSHGCGTVILRMRHCVFGLITLWSVAETVAIAGNGGWVVSERHGNVEIYSQFHLNRAEVMGELRDVESELIRLLGLPGNEQPVQLILFQDHGSYLNYLSARLPESRSRRALFYQNGNTGQIYAIRGRALLTDLRHEYTHALLHQQLRFIPLWLDEGLAEYLETRSTERLATRRAAGLKWKARLGWQASLTDLEALDGPLQMTADDYTQSWAIVCFLANHSPKTRQILQNYVQTIAGGEAPGRFSRFASEELPELGFEVNSYFRKPQIRLTSGSPR
jgi:hypothetical protein